MKRVALVGAVMLCITAAAVGGLLSWDNGNQGRESQGYAGGPPPMSLHDYGGEPGEDAGYGPEGVPSFMVVGDWGCSSNCPQFPTADTDQLSVSEQMTKASKVMISYPSATKVLPNTHLSVFLIVFSILLSPGPSTIPFDSLSLSLTHSLTHSLSLSLYP